MTSRATSGADVCVLISVFGTAVWAGAVALIVRAAGRRPCCPPWCPGCVEGDYTESAEGGEIPPFWRYAMPIQRRGD